MSTSRRKLRDTMLGDFSPSFPICRRGNIQCCSFSVYKLWYLYGTRWDNENDSYLRFDVANIEITCDQASQRKWENLRTTWSQVNEEKSDIVRESLPAKDIIQYTKAELFTFFLVSKYALSFSKRLLKTVSTEGEFICSICVSAKCDC